MCRNLLLLTFSLKFDYYQRMPKPYLSVEISTKIDAVSEHIPGHREVWGSYVEKNGGKEFETDGVIGFLYEVSEGSVWLNELGYPTKIFLSQGAINTYLETLSDKINWDINKH